MQSLQEVLTDDELKREALNVIATLPADTEEALRVLAYAKQIIEMVFRPEKKAAPNGTVLGFPADEAARDAAHAAHAAQRPRK